MFYFIYLVAFFYHIFQILIKIEFPTLSVFAKTIKNNSIVRLNFFAEKTFGSERWCGSEEGDYQIWYD